MIVFVVFVIGLALALNYLATRDPHVSDECHDGDCEDCPGIEVDGDVIACCECECHEVERQDPVPESDDEPEPEPA